MSKIIVEDLTKEDKPDTMVPLVADEILRFVGQLGFTYALTAEKICKALFISAELIGIIGQKVGTITDLDQIKQDAIKFSKEREKFLEESGLNTIIENIKKHTK